VLVEGDQLVVDRKPADRILLAGGSPWLASDELWSGIGIHGSRVREQLRSDHLCGLARTEGFEETVWK
jgi:hypothetical protein